MSALNPPCVWLNAQAVRRNIRLVLNRPPVDLHEAAAWLRSDLIVTAPPAARATSLHADNDS